MRCTNRILVLRLREGEMAGCGRCIFKLYKFTVVPVGTMFLCRGWWPPHIHMLFWWCLMLMFVVIIAGGFLINIGNTWPTVPNVTKSVPACQFMRVRKWNQEWGTWRTPLESPRSNFFHPSFHTILQNMHICFHHWFNDTNNSTICVDCVIYASHLLVRSIASLASDFQPTDSQSFSLWYIGLSYINPCPVPCFLFVSSSLPLTMSSWSLRCLCHTKTSELASFF